MKPGLVRMRDAVPDGACPFCLEPIAPGKNGKGMKHCGDEACERAYHRTYQRDRRAGVLVAAVKREAYAFVARAIIEQLNSDFHPLDGPAVARRTQLSPGVDAEVIKIQHVMSAAAAIEEPAENEGDSKHEAC